MKKKSSTKGKAGEITLSGELTISRAAEILAILKESLQASEEVRITFRDVTALDISCLQLFCSAHRTAALEHKTLGLEAPLPDRFLEMIRLTGFKRRKGCSFSPNTNCICYDGGA